MSDPDWTCAECGYEARFDRAPEWDWSLVDHPRAGVGPERCHGGSVSAARRRQGERPNPAPAPAHGSLFG